MKKLEREKKHFSFKDLIEGMVKIDKIYFNDVFVRNL